MAETALLVVIGLFVITLVHLEEVMGKIEDLSAKVDLMSLVVDKIKSETTASLVTIAELRDLIANGGVITPEFEAKLGDLEARLNAVDALVEDAPAPGPTE